MIFFRPQNIFLFLLISLSVFPAAYSQNKKTEVVVVSTLHQFHAQNANYSFEKLSQIIVKLKPDVIAVELTPKDLASRREQKTKQEYRESIFPVADKHKYALVPLEPDEPKFSELIRLIREAEQSLSEKAPDKAQAFSLYSDNLYEYLFRFWNSPAAVNSAQTDAMFEVKHNFQNALFGENERQGWEGWNRNFLEKILEAAERNKGKRIVVTVGAEHAYWLRKHLRQIQTIRLIEAETVFR